MDDVSYNAILNRDDELTREDIYVIVLLKDDIVFHNYNIFRV